MREGEDALTDVWRLINLGDKSGVLGVDVWSCFAMIASGGKDSLILTIGEVVYERGDATLTFVCP